jgi:transcription elongation factor GreA
MELYYSYMLSSRFLTPNGLEMARKKLKELENELDFVLSQKGEAAQTGGNEWHDNAAFEELVRKEQMLYVRMDELRNIISGAEVVEEKSGNKKAGIGSVVAVKFENGREAEYKIVGLMESDPSKNHVSYETPLGSALMGAKKGQKREFLAGGEKKVVEVLEIR